MNAGIPTMYAGVRFRSRLEARWARVFDAIGWQWDYEPLDLAGYIPDFVLSLERPVLVEVKPCVNDAEADGAIRKIHSSGWNGEALLVGSTIREFGLDQWHGVPWARWAMEDGYDPEECAETVGDSTLVACTACRRVAFTSEHGWWRCRVCGHYDEGANFEALPTGAFARLWRGAGNAVQWQPRRTV